MRYFSLTSLPLLALAATQARAGIPAAGEFTQLQPINKGPFPRLPCLTVFSAANGSAVVIEDCTASTQQRGWNVVAGGSSTGAGPPTAIQIFNTFCLEVTGGVNADGTKVEINSCIAGNPNQLWQWNSDSTVQWVGTNKCLDLTDGSLVNGNQMQIWTCLPVGNPHQQWTSNPLANPFNEVVLVSDTSLCMAADSVENGAPVFIASCDDPTAHKVWGLPQIGHGNSGRYTLDFGDGLKVKCLDVTDGKAVPGTKLQLWDCTDQDVNQFWIPTGVIRWEGTGLLDALCVDLTDGIKNKGNQLQIWNCTAGNTNQFWNDVVPAQLDI